MNELNLNYFLMLDDNIRYLYNGIISSDELNDIDENDERIYIVNVDPSYMPGSHWIVMYTNNYRCEFFDSLGNHPSIYGIHFDSFISKCNSLTFSMNKLQSKTSTKCGMYCIYYCFYKARGYDINQIVNTFTKNQTNNDNMMDAFMEWYNEQVE